jgi:Domain of unknown function (DUF4412)
MKKHFALLVSVIVGLSVVTARAQPRTPSAPNFDGDMDKLFGDNSGFSATMEFRSAGPSGEEVEMSAKVVHVEGKARIEMDISEMQGSHIPPQTAARMKQMGMSKTTMIMRSDKGITYVVYPDMKAYTEMGGQEKRAAMSEYKTETTKLGQETIDGHDCVKNKVVVTGPSGAPHDSTVWNATDLKQFPVKIETASVNGNASVILFKEVKLDKPDDAQFDPPSDYKKYDNMMSLMMSRARGAPPQ